MEHEIMWAPIGEKPIEDKRRKTVERCKSCGAPIMWAHLPSGKIMPVNIEPTTYWERKGAKGKIVTSYGKVVSCDFEGDPNTATGFGYIPHWATCPNADQHRK